jgi:hypothetical protein
MLRALAVPVLLQVEPLQAVRTPKLRSVRTAQQSGASQPQVCARCCLEIRSMPLPAVCTAVTTACCRLQLTDAKSALKSGWREVQHGAEQLRRTAQHGTTAVQRSLKRGSHEVGQRVALPTLDIRSHLQQIPRSEIGDHLLAALCFAAGCVLGHLTECTHSVRSCSG